MGIFKRFRKSNDELFFNAQNAYAVAKLTLELRNYPKAFVSDRVLSKLLEFTNLALPIDSDAALRLTQRASKNNQAAQSELAEWLLAGLSIRNKGVKSAILNSSLMNVPPEVLFAKYIDNAALNDDELVILDAKSKQYEEGKFISNLSDKRVADFLVSKQIAKSWVDLLVERESYIVAISKLSASFLIEWKHSDIRCKLI
jgi:hypothetical protein